MSSNDDYQAQLEREEDERQRQREQEDYLRRLEQDDYQRWLEEDQRLRQQDDEQRRLAQRRSEDDQQRLEADERLQEDERQREEDQRHQDEVARVAARRHRSAGNNGDAADGWYFRWLWSRRVREDRERAEDSERRRVAHPEPLAGHRMAGRGRTAMRWSRRLAASGVLLLVAGAGYQLWTAARNADIGARYVAPPALSAAAELEQPPAENALPGTDDAFSLLVDRLGDLDTALATQQTGQQTLLAEQRTMAESVDRLDTALDRLTTTLTELLDKSSARETRLLDKLDAVLTAQQTQQQTLLQRLTRLAVQHPPADPEPPTRSSTAPPARLPFRLIAVDYLGDRHYATLSLGGRLHRAAQHEILAGWTVESIDPLTQRVVFSRDGRRLAQTVATP